MQSTNEVFAALREIAVLLEFSRAPKFKVKAYERGADVVKTVGELGPLVEQGRLAELEGIGATLSAQIQELWNTGSSQYLLRLRSEQPPGTSEMAQVEGVTPARLRLLVEGLGVRSVSELRAPKAACAGCRASDRRPRLAYCKPATAGSGAGKRRPDPCCWLVLASAPPPCRQRCWRRRSAWSWWAHSGAAKKRCVSWSG